MNEFITLSDGDGGINTSRLIQNVFYKRYADEHGDIGSDAAILERQPGKLAFTTDSFVVKPLFFPGGDIGKLAVCGTINDLTVSGAKPLFLSCGFIIEEGFPLAHLEEIASSMGEICIQTGVQIVTGDTKVVERGAVDGIFINTAGIGNVNGTFCAKEVEPGDVVILSGDIARHGTAIAIERFNLPVENSITSDCMPLSPILDVLAEYGDQIKCMKDPTRGGIATALHELATSNNAHIRIRQNDIPIKPEVLAVNRMIGLDPLYVACEGRMLLIVEEQVAEYMLSRLRSCNGCDDATIIGSIVATDERPQLTIETQIGGTFLLGPLSGEMLPRIC